MFLRLEKWVEFLWGKRSTENALPNAETEILLPYTYRFFVLTTKSVDVP